MNKIKFFVRNFSSLNHKFIETLTTSTKGINLENINEAIKTSPEITNYSPELWQRSHDLLVEQGINSSNFLSMIVSHPSLLHRKHENIIQSLETWRSSQFGGKLVLVLIEKYPQLLDITDESDLNIKIENLKKYAGGVKNVWRLFLNSPNLVYDKISTTDVKVDYLRDVMRVDVAEVVKSAVFSNTFEEIRCRHVFLERLGLYKPKSKKADPAEPSKNPKLYTIMDTSDKRFATKVAFVTLEEFEAFQELFKRELVKTRNVDSEEYLEEE